MCCSDYLVTQSYAATCTHNLIGSIYVESSFTATVTCKTTVWNHEPILRYSTITIYSRSTHLLLSLSHCKEFKPVSTIALWLCQFAQLTSRISPWTQDEHNGRLGGGLVIYALQTDHGRGDILLSHPPRDKVGDGTVHTIHSEAPQQHQLLQVRKTFFVPAWVGRRLRVVQVKPLHMSRVEVNGMRDRKVRKKRWFQWYQLHYASLYFHCVYICCGNWRCCSFIILLVTQV